jgi:hypothetical protein
MQRGRFSEEPIVRILKEHEAGRKIGELARQHDASEATLRVQEQRLRSLHDENRR